MKLEVLREDLIRGIGAVQNIVNTKTTLPILSYILLEAQQDGLHLVSTDLDIGISCVIPVNSVELGAICLPAKRFSDIIKELSEQQVSITTKKNSLVYIETPKCQFKLMGLAKEEFPKLPEFKDSEVIKLEQAGLKKMLSLVSFAVSQDETRYILNGVLFRVSNTDMALVATDGRRLSLSEKKLSTTIHRDISMIIPIKTIYELMRNLKEEGEISLVIGQSQVMFNLDKIIVISRLIEGEFPEYKQVIPPISGNSLTVDRQQFLLGARRASLLATMDYQAMKLELFPAKGSASGNAKLIISKSTPDVGESREELAAVYSGKELVVGFNPAYIIDVLKNLSDDTVSLELTEPDKPAVIRSNGYTYVILPMRLG